MNDLQKIYNMSYQQYTDLMRQRAQQLQPMQGQMAQPMQMQQAQPMQHHNNSMAQGQAVGGLINDFTSGYFDAGGYGLGSTGYGLAYNINPNGEQAQMLASQW